MDVLGTAQFNSRINWAGATRVACCLTEHLPAGVLHSYGRVFDCRAVRRPVAWGEQSYAVKEICELDDIVDIDLLGPAVYHR